MSGEDCKITREKWAGLGRIGLAFLAIGVLLCALFVVYLGYPYFSGDGIGPSQTPAPSHEELVDYALSLINADRQMRENVQNVSLSLTDSAQLHAEDMLRNHYFSHWDTRGFKPYVRYTLAGGEGAVRENIAAQFGYDSDVREVIKDLEWSMMYDDAEFDWGHRDNIVDPFHNKVSIGIAYDDESVYLVQDFEDDYVEWATLNVSDGDVTMKGQIALPGLTIQQVAVYFDKPVNLTAQQLENPPYNGSYSTGTLVGAALPPGWEATEGITIEATAWSQAGQDFRITFDLSPAFARNGEGAYTLYLFTDGAKCLTTYSVFDLG